MVGNDWDAGNEDEDDGCELAARCVRLRALLNRISQHMDSVTGDQINRS